MQAAAAREAQRRGQAAGTSAPLTPRGCPYGSVSPTHLQLCSVHWPPAPLSLTQGRGTVGEIQVLAERLWERIVWVGQVVVCFQPLGLIPEVTGTHHTRSCAPLGRPEPQAQRLLCHYYSNCCLSPPHPHPTPHADSCRRRTASGICGERNAGEEEAEPDQ